MKTEKDKDSGRMLFGADKALSLGVLIFVTAVFTLILYPNLIISQEAYKLGDVVERDIKAPKDFFIEDAEATEAGRRQAVAAVLPVYDLDASLADTLTAHIKAAFKMVADVIEQAEANAPPAEGLADAAPADAAESKAEVDLHEKIWQLKPAFEEKLGIQVSKGAYGVLEKERFSPRIPQLITRILSTILENGVVSNKDILLKESDRGIVLRTVGTKSETTEKNLKRFYGLDQAKTMVRIVGQPVLADVNYALLNLIVDLSQRLIQPNITPNRNETEERKRLSADQVKPTLYKIKAGEMLLREGERVTQEQLVKLKHLQTQVKQDTVIMRSLGGALLFLCLFFTVHVLHLKHQRLFVNTPNKNLIFSACVLVMFFFLAAVSASLADLLAHSLPLSIPVSSMYLGVPLAAGAMLVCLFMGLEMAVAFAILFAICTALLFQNNLEIFIYYLVSGCMGAYWIRNCREHKVFILAGLKVGALNAALAVVLNVYMAEFSGFHFLWDLAFAFQGGIAAGIVAAGLAPLVEIAFDYKTDIALLELANLDRPLLRRMMIEVPGTYHHSVIVGTMVEAGAAEIGANPLMGRVCGYYHDIGKMRKPLYFIENQFDGKNRHDKLAPSMSSLILISHVKNGVEMARQNKLGQRIIDTIRQHHGTTLIRYFYDKAKQQKGEDAINIDDYRYPGPKPQSVEAALVMLADVVEAASRTLENPTPSRIQGLVHTLINKIFSDGQLDECDLTLKDLHKIAKSFNKILNGIYHHRIEYSENTGTSGNGSGKSRGKNGHSDRQPAKPSKHIPETDSTNGSGSLKRLGIG